jgi:hypothetical protein
VWHFGSEVRRWGEEEEEKEKGELSGRFNVKGLTPRKLGFVPPSGKPKLFGCLNTRWIAYKAEEGLYLCFLIGSVLLEYYDVQKYLLGDRHGFMLTIYRTHNCNGSIIQPIIYKDRTSYSSHL